MALIQKNNPVGIDDVIARIQKYLFDNISWTASGRYQSYQRAYKNETNDGTDFEVFVKKNDYQDIKYDDNFFATSFFIVNDDVNFVKRKELSNISMIFQIDLSKLYHSVTHRADEEAHREVIDILKNNPPGWKISKLTKGIRKVYTEIGYGENKFDDLQPCHVFRIDFEDATICC